MPEFQGFIRDFLFFIIGKFRRSFDKIVERVETFPVKE